MAGMPEPKVASTLRSRGQKIDAAVDEAVNGKSTTVEEPPTPVKGAPSPKRGFFHTLKSVLGMGGINPDGTDK